MEIPTIGRGQLSAREHVKDCAVCAYHESGHILFAYLCGYSCRQVSLVKENEEEGFVTVAHIDYGRDERLVARFMGAEANIDYFNCLSLGEKLESIEVGRRLARIMLGGSVAAAVFNNEGHVLIPLPMQIDFTDLTKVEFIQQVLNSISTEQETQFIENGLREALYSLSNINIWHTIADLARRLLQHRQLDKVDIEACLEEHGIIYDQASPPAVPDPLG
jgi:hypothetical protein